MGFASLNLGHKIISLAFIYVDSNLSNYILQVFFFFFLERACFITALNYFLHCSVFPLLFYVGLFFSSGTMEMSIAFLFSSSQVNLFERTR